MADVVVGMGTTTLHSLKAQYTWKIKNINDAIHLYRRPLQSNSLKLYQKSTGQSWDWWLSLERSSNSMSKVNLYLKPLSTNCDPAMTVAYKLCVGNPAQPNKHYKTQGTREFKLHVQDNCILSARGDLLKYVEASEDNQKGILRVVVDLEVAVPAVTELQTVEFPECITKRSLPNNTHLYHGKAFADVTLQCDNRVFQAHKLILGQSSVFLAMLNSQMKEGLTRKIIISDVDASVLELLLKFLYGVSFEMPSEQNQLLQLLDCAEKYILEELKWDCLMKMRSILSDDNAAEFTIAVCKYSEDEEIRNSFRSYCLRRIHILLQNDNFKQLFKENLDIFVIPP